MKGKFDFKKLWKRNQIMITALALMIAIAGYLNFTGKQIDDEILFTTSAQFEEADASLIEETMSEEQALLEENAAYDISDDDMDYYTEIESLDEDFTLSEGLIDEEVAEGYYEDMDLTAEMTLITDETASVEGVMPETASADEVLETAAQTQGEDIPGEAVFTNTVSVTSLAEANLLKEQTRAQNKAALMDIINNENISDAAKQEAVNSMIALTDLAQKECETLVMLEAKGFPDAVISINSDSVDVCIGMNQLTAAQIAQIEDIVKRKTGIPAEKIIISPVGEN
ncbi:MAG: SpoIIIAH-like family protein [Lachnospiraceae bacterium]|nr:SpoIIIAH-like family protein [Lachnospiraceae bacterium]